jgi:hypothetical protein
MAPTIPAADSAETVRPRPRFVTAPTAAAAESALSTLRRSIGCVPSLPFSYKYGWKLKGLPIRKTRADTIADTAVTRHLYPEIAVVCFQRFSGI